MKRHLYGLAACGLVFLASRIGQSLPQLRWLAWLLVLAGAVLVFFGGRHFSSSVWEKLTGRRK